MSRRKKHNIPFISGLEEMAQSEVNNTLVNSGFKGKVDQLNWKEYPYNPEVVFYLAHNNSELYILYKVNEENIRASYMNDNDAVWEDSCVEAFLSNNMNDGYYNIEVNCIGTTLVAYGGGRENRTHLDGDQMKRIKRAASLGKSILGKENMNGLWWLQITIPLEMLGIKPGENLWANFYKCGDRCKVPHFLSWQPIQTEQPDFHRPEFFATLKLE